MGRTRCQLRLKNHPQDKSQIAPSPENAVSKPPSKETSNSNRSPDPPVTLNNLPPEIILQIASHLYGDGRQIYVFTKRPRDLGWHLLIRALLPSPFTSNSRPRRYGCRTIFPIRPLLDKPSLHTDRVAFAATHPYFEAVLKSADALPYTRPPKPVTPAPLEVWVEGWKLMRQMIVESELEVMVVRGVWRCKLKDQFWLVENTTDEEALEGWGMIWMEGKRDDAYWPRGIPRVGVPYPYERVPGEGVVFM